MPRSLADTTAEQARVLPIILAQLADGESMNTICASPGMPDRRTVQRWCNGDGDLAEQVLEAREAGYLNRAERAVQAAKTCEDPIKGRLAFDAERWYLGKLSQVFAERAPRIASQTNVQVNLDGSPFGQLAELMDRAAASVAGGAERTYRVADESEAGSGSP